MTNDQDLVDYLVKAHEDEPYYLELIPRQELALGEAEARVAKLTDDVSKLAAQNEAYQQALIGYWDNNQAFTALEKAHEMMEKRLQIGPLALKQAQTRAAKLRKHLNDSKRYLATLEHARITRERLQADALAARERQQVEDEYQKAKWLADPNHQAITQLLENEKNGELERQERQNQVAANSAARAVQSHALQAEAQAAVDKVIDSAEKGRKK